VNLLLWAIRLNYVLSYRLYPFYLFALIQNRRWSPVSFEDIDRKHQRTIFLQHVRDYMKVKHVVTETELKNV